MLMVNDVNEDEGEAVDEQSLTPASFDGTTTGGGEWSGHVPRRKRRGR